MKKLLALLLALVMVLSLTACGSSTDSDDSAAEDGESGTNETIEETAEAESEISADVENEAVYPIEIESDWGTAVFESEVNAIAVFDIGMLDILDTLGFGDRVVAVTSGLAMPDYLSDYSGDSYVDLGGFKDWDQDALAESNPDLILAGFRQTKSVDVVDAIAPVIYFGTTDADTAEAYMAWLEDRVGAITTLFGGADEAQEYLDQIQEMIDAIQAYTAENEITFISVTCEDGGLSIGGNNSSSLLGGVLGLVSAYEEEEDSGQGRGGDTGSEAESASAEAADGETRSEGRVEDESSSDELETVDVTEQNATVANTIIETAPTYVFVFDKDAGENMTDVETAQEAVESTELVNSDLYQEGRIVYMDEALWYSADGGLTSTIMQLEQIMELLGIS
ncbi:MAG: ABC transporter substrate-binding protein [Oscillospiraceae bacterium]|nr:ABC transporter substrate-binding protein [Oscillospiraceae bacterium]